MKKKVLGLVLVAVILMTTACTKDSREDTSEIIREKGRLVMGMDDSFAPMGFRDKEGKLVGFDVDLARELAARLDLELDLQPIDWSMKEAELNSGKIDLIWNGYSITEARKKEVNFSRPYLSNRQLIICLSDSDIKSKEDLRGKRLALQNASSSWEAVNKDQEFIGGLEGGEPILFDTNHEAIMDMENGRSDAVVSDEVLARYYIREKGEEKYRILEEDFGSEEYGIGLRKWDKILLEDINRALETMMEDGSYDAIYSKWFN